MEKPLSREELFNGLLEKVRNPFTSDEQKNDIRRILISSSSFFFTPESVIFKDSMATRRLSLDIYVPASLRDEKKAERYSFLSLKSTSYSDLSIPILQNSSLSIYSVRMRADTKRTALRQSLFITHFRIHQRDVHISYRVSGRHDGYLIPDTLVPVLVDAL